ncbi:DoxX family protein [Fulvivirga lutea]|uniref:DoxX family membrane protein n=1 Tax=Fulvivirga lutea TaxID=2810512 RepID=A0A974WJL2_9BACT|nr:MauE/DoxX family redox-associated membrane protein [Fulvivirga lutea]QSE96543.1 DoxX family membrane protein [Fulvivirga lutea]
MGTQLKKISRYGMVGFYLFAGANHFINPEFYYLLIPDYLPFPKLINFASGLVEMALAVLLLFDRFKRWAAYGIIAMLICFIPSHVHFILIGSCITDGLCVPEWVGWIRLLLIHPLLMYWAYTNRN